jgi:peroxiredoxin
MYFIVMLTVNAHQLSPGPDDNQGVYAVSTSTQNLALSSDQSKSDRAGQFSLSSETFVRPTLLQTVRGQAVSIPDPQGKIIHLRFLRWAGCSICSLGLIAFRRRAAELEAANIREVIVFHSSIGDVEDAQSNLPFDLVADPHRSLYRSFGVGSSLFFLMHPRTIWSFFKSFGVESDLKMTNGPFGLPADFLIAPSGKLIAAKYGRHADDSWEVEDVLAFARSFKVRLNPTKCKTEQGEQTMAVPSAFIGDQISEAQQTLTAGKIAKLVAFTIPIWFLAAMYIRFRGPHGSFSGTRVIILYVLTVPFTMPLNFLSRRIVSLPKRELPKVIAVTSATAILLDGFAMNFFTGLYGSDRTVIMGGAAWLLWAVGVALTLALVSASSSQLSET